MIFETAFPHGVRIEKVAAIDDQGSAHRVANASPIKLPEFGPLGEDEQGIGIASDVEGFAAELHLGEDGGGLVHGLLVVSANLHAFVQEPSNHFERWREANVVGVGLERQTQDANSLVFNHPQGVADLLEEQIDAALVDLLGVFEHVEVHARTLREADKRLNVFGQAEAAKTESRAQKLRADARVEAHGMDDFLDISANFFAQIGNHVGVGNFQGEERIGGVLDEFGAVDGGNDQFWRFRRGAAAQMHGAVKLCLQDGAVDFAELFFAVMVLDAEHDAVGMQKILEIYRDRKSTRLNSSHVEISYAVFCLKKKISEVIPSTCPEAWYAQPPARSHVAAR